ncbi:MAG: DUF4330 domain-containing protein [Clostridia bacterium]|nr:DUF4330 domain-containing protein [Clostridia bacterium]
MDNKKKNRFNIIDVFVIAAILALIAGVIFFAVRESGDFYTERREKNITYTVRISGVSKDYLSSFEEEGHVLNASTLNYIGTISKIKTEKTPTGKSEAVQNGTGGYVIVQTKYNDIYDVYITVTAKTAPDGRGVAYVDGQRMTIGSEMYLRCGNFSATGYITNFSIS